MTLCAGVGCQTSFTASHISTAKSSSVPVKLSGEYSNTQSVSGRAAAQSRITLAPATAMSRMPARSIPKTTRRCVVEVELYRWTIARLTPRSASNVRRISGSRACVSTCTVTSSGIMPLVDQLADEIEVGLRRGRETDLDLLVPQADQQAEQLELALGVHRLDQRLVAVAQVDAAPLRRTVDHPRRPLPVGQRDRRRRAGTCGTGRCSWSALGARTNCTDSPTDAPAAIGVRLELGEVVYVRAGRSRSSSGPPEREVGAGSAGRPEVRVQLMAEL